VLALGSITEAAFNKVKNLLTSNNLLVNSDASKELIRDEPILLE